MNTYKVLFRRAAADIAQAQHVLVVSPEAPDGDSVGSALAFRLYLVGQNKKVSAWCSDPIPDRPLMRAMPGAEFFSASVPDGVDLIVAFDYGDVSRLRLPAALLDNTRMIGFDHHGPSRFSDARSFEIVDESATATTQLIYHFFKFLKVPISNDMAWCLFVGICTDSEFFRNPLTNADALRTAADLIDCGASIRKVSNLMVPAYSDVTVRAWSRALENLEIQGTRALLFFSQKEFSELGATYRDIAGLMGSLLEHVHGLELAGIITETPKGTWVASLRSPNGQLNVADVAARFGGGGHPSAAGFQSSRSKGQIRRLIFSQQSPA